jgi:pimeloyl-ACP methyl ester carboxylesterase
MIAAMADVARPTTVAGPVEYRYEQRGGATVVVFHGGHMHAGIAIGEDVFADAGHSVLVPSRPGYGRTPLTTVGAFVEDVAQLCAHLGITEVAAVVGISAGGPTAMAMAARHPGLVRRVILESAVGPLPWPDPRTRIAAGVVFRPGVERLTWRGVGALVRSAPDAGLRMLLRDLSTLPARQVVGALSGADRRELVAMFSHMRSGQGFRNDLAVLRDDLADVTQPAVVIASRHDGSVPFAHAEALVATIAGSVLIESAADSHLVWLGPDWPAIGDRIRRFVAGQA